MAQYIKIKLKPVVKTKEKSKEPDNSKVVLLNDDFTTMEFVVEILMLIFHKNSDEAKKIMLEVHRNGKGTVGIFPNDIAQTKTEQVHAAARDKEFPLRCVVEPL